MAIKYGFLKNSIVDGTFQIDAGQWVRFDDSDPFWAAYAGMGVFNRPLEESINLDEGFASPSSISDQAPAPKKLKDGSVVNPKIFDAVKGASQDKPDKKGRE